jgi:tetratricopeptide (TPR) repeat protein
MPMSPSEPPAPTPPIHETLRELIADPDVREQLVETLAAELEERREPSPWRRIRPWLAGAASAAVTLLAFFLPSLQDQWDRWQSRSVIQRYVALGRDFMHEGRYQLAEETFAKAFELSESRRLDIEEQRLAAKVARVNEDPEWGRGNPEGLEESDFLYLFQLQQGRGAAARRAQAATLNSYGVFLTAERRFAEAESTFRRSLALDGGDASAWVRLGNALVDRGRSAEAERAYRRGLALDPRSVSGHYDLGLLLAQSGRAAAAESSLQRALALSPRDTDALRVLAEWRERDGRTAEAAELRGRLARALAEMPPRPAPRPKPADEE